jgi:predicted HNH restriction endonuclease
MSYKTLSDPNYCYFCKTKKEYKKNKFRSIIEVHHIKEKNEGGTNEEYNLVHCCSNCHSLIHLDNIKIDKWYFSTRGWILHYWKDEKEFWGN